MPSLGLLKKKQDTGIAIPKVGPCQKVRTDHLQAVAPRFVTPRHQGSCFQGLLDHRQLVLVQLEVDDLPGLSFLPG